MTWKATAHSGFDGFSLSTETGDNKIFYLNSETNNYNAASTYTLTLNRNEVLSTLVRFTEIKSTHTYCAHVGKRGLIYKSQSECRLE